MDTTALQRFKDALGQNDRVAIVVGKNPSLDEMGAALSLYLSLKATNKAVSIASLSQPIVEHSSLVAIDEVRGSVGSAGGDLVVSFPYQEGAIEKVSYTIENGLLNIVVKAGEQGLSFQEQDVKFTRGGGAPSLVIVVGTPSLALLGDMLQGDSLREAMIVNIDNKAENENFGDIVLVSPQYSSISEFMANLILSNGLPLDIDGAQNLMYGISYATNNFQNPNTSYFAFEIVAELMRRGAVRVQTAPQHVQAPAYMQPQAAVNQPQSRNQQANQGQRPQGMPRQNFPQQRNQQSQQRNQQRGNQQRQQNQGTRQDEIRRALAEQARSMQNQQMNDAVTSAPVQSQPVPQPQMPQQPITQPQPQMQPDNTQQPVEAPSDWLTPKVYKGSSNPS